MTPFEIHTSYTTFFSLVVAVWLEKPVWTALDHSSVAIFSEQKWTQEDWSKLWQRDFSTKLPVGDIRENYLKAIGELIQQGSYANRNLRAQAGCQNGFEKLTQTALYPEMDLSLPDLLKVACSPNNFMTAQYRVLVENRSDS
jgi:hypothetical protein